MKLLTKQIEKSLPPLYANDGNWLLFRLVEGFEKERGYFQPERVAVDPWTLC